MSASSLALLGLVEAGLGSCSARASMPFLTAGKPFLTMKKSRTRNESAPQMISFVAGRIGLTFSSASATCSPASWAKARIGGDHHVAASYANFRRMKTTNPIRASASVKAMPRNMVVRTMPAASGWRAMAVMALPTTMPMPMPGPMAAAP